MKEVISTILVLLAFSVACENVAIENSEIVLTTKTGQKKNITNDGLPKYNLAINPNGDKAIYTNIVKPYQTSFIVINTTNGKVDKEIKLDMDITSIGKICWLTNEMFYFIGDVEHGKLGEQDFAMIDTRVEGWQFNTKGLFYIVTPGSEYVFSKTLLPKHGLPEEKDFDSIEAVFLKGIKDSNKFSPENYSCIFPSGSPEIIVNSEQRPHIISRLDWNEKKKALAFLVQYNEGSNMKTLLTTVGFKDYKVEAIEQILFPVEFRSSDIVDFKWNADKSILIRSVKSNKDSNGKNIVALVEFIVDVISKEVQSNQIGDQIDKADLQKRFGASLTQKIIAEAIAVNMDSDRISDIIARTQMLLVETNKQKPVIHFKEIVVDLGKIEAGKTTKASFVYSNNGGSELQVKGFRTTGVAKAVAVPIRKLKSGESDSIAFIIQTKDSVGKNKIDIFVKSNDLTTPEAHLEVHYEIVDNTKK